jgi:hypothetical protein
MPDDLVQPALVVRWRPKRRGVWRSSARALDERVE